MSSAHELRHHGQEGGFARHSWLAGELKNDAMLFKCKNTPNTLGPGAYSTKGYLGPEPIKTRSFNYFVNKSEQIAKQKERAWLARKQRSRMHGMSWHDGSEYYENLMAGDINDALPPDYMRPYNSGPFGTLIHEGANSPKHDGAGLTSQQKAVYFDGAGAAL